VEPVETVAPDRRSERRGAARERTRRRREDKVLPAPNWTWAIFAVAIAGVIGVITLVAWASSRGSQGDQGNTQPGIANDGPSPTFDGNATPLPVPAIHAWDGKQRYSVLIMGIDKRPGDIGTGFNTDTLILVSINPLNKSIGMLSIPRDVFVALPGQSNMQRINSIYAAGELQQPGYGPKLLVQAMRYNFGMPINSYVVVSFDAVINLVDDIGGVDINVPTPIDDPEYPDMYNGYDPLHIPSGLVHMDGQLALKYARTRHQDTDYERTRRQQQLILAIRQKAIQPQVLAQVLGQATTIWEQISKGIITDITFNQALSLGWYAKDIPANSIQHGTVDEKYLQAVQYNGDAVVIPNRSTIGQLMAQVFGTDYSR
jgi:LCP family protein required for cell wall assembly